MASNVSMYGAVEAAVKEIDKFFMQFFAICNIAELAIEAFLKEKHLPTILIGTMFNVWEKMREST